MNLAQLWAGWTAHELAGAAAAVAGTAAGLPQYRPSGVLAERAATLEDLQREATVAAVVAERVDGASWDRIGDAFLITRQAAQKRFGKWEEPFRTAVALPAAARRHVATASEVLRDPDRYAQLLADAVPAADSDHHTDALMIDPDRFVTCEIANVARLASMIANRQLPTGVDELDARLELQDRKIGLYEAKLTLQPDRSGDHGDTLEALNEARIVRDHVLEQLGDEDRYKHALVAGETLTSTKLGDDDRDA